MADAFNEPPFEHCEDARAIRWVFRIRDIQPGCETEKKIMAETCKTARWMIMRYTGPYMHGYVVFKQCRSTNGVRIAFGTDCVSCMPWRRGTISARLARLLMLDQGNAIEFGLVTMQGRTSRLTEMERLRALLNERIRNHHPDDFTPPGWVRHRIIDRRMLFFCYDN